MPCLGKNFFYPFANFFAKFSSAGLSAEPGRELLQDSLELGAALARLVHPARHHSPPLSKLLRAGAHPVVGAIFARRAQVCDSVKYVIARISC